MGVRIAGGYPMNWMNFFLMKGYAWYVWGSYGVVLVVIAIEIAMVIRKRKIALQQLRLICENGLVADLRNKE